MEAVKPFLVVTNPHAVQRSHWIVATDSRELSANPERLTAWGIDTTFKVSCEVEIDAAQVTTDCGLSGDASFCLTTSWSTGAGRFGRARQVVGRTTIPPHGKRREAVEFAISGQLLDSNLRLHLDLTLARIGRPISKLAPSHFGTRLWEDAWVIALEEVPGFPTQVADFTKFYSDKREQLAPWRVSWNRQLDADFHGSVVLILNSAHPTAVESFRSKQALTLELALSDAVESMLRHAVEIGAHLIPDDPNTVRGVLAYWAEEIFGTAETDDLKDIFERDQETARARIRGWCRQ
ncbi:MAG: hypothetical protein EOP84_00405 [Verrucomicrobiaceae bacterium]|nr:MAG: hypothetical protein EOP84_00405 [Verrucomicrobiaceae bacterium]